MFRSADLQNKINYNTAEYQTQMLQLDLRIKLPCFKTCSKLILKNFSNGDLLYETLDFFISYGHTQRSTLNSTHTTYETYIKNKSKSKIIYVQITKLNHILTIHYLAQNVLSHGKFASFPYSNQFSTMLKKISIRHVLKCLPYCFLFMLLNSKPIRYHANPSGLQKISYLYTPTYSSITVVTNQQ